MVDVYDVFVDYRKIGSEIRRWRKRIGLSQEKLGELVGLSQKQISRIENYGTDSLWKVKNIAAVFGITIDELIGAREELQDREEPEGR